MRGPRCSQNSLAQARVCIVPLSSAVPLSPGSLSYPRAGYSMGPPRFVVLGSAGQVQGPLSVEPQALSPLEEILGQVSETRGPKEAQKRPAPHDRDLRRRDPGKERGLCLLFSLISEEPNSRGGATSGSHMNPDRPSLLSGALARPQCGHERTHTASHVHTLTRVHTPADTHPSTCACLDSALMVVVKSARQGFSAREPGGKKVQLEFRLEI